jgi:predicted Fe-Mo cluster-binding NifX family protein
MAGEAHRGKLEMMAMALKGFDAVVAKSFGEPAKEFLKEDGILPFQTDCAVKDAVRAAVKAVYDERAKVFE